MSLLEELRALSKKEEKRSLSPQEILAMRVEEARKIMLAKAGEKQREAVIFTVVDFDGMIDLSMVRDPGEEYFLRKSDLRRQYSARTPQDLRGLAADLRDWVIAEGLELSLRFEARGNSCKTRHLAWDLVVRW